MKYALWFIGGLFAGVPLALIVLSLCLAARDRSYWG